MSIVLVLVAVPAPLYKALDYSVPEGMRELAPGARVRVPLGRRSVVGVVVEPPRRITAAPMACRPVEALLDLGPALPDELLSLLRWTAYYYGHPPGEVLNAALPGPLRRGEDCAIEQAQLLRLTTAGVEALAALPARAARQRELLKALQTPRSRDELAGASAQLKRALELGWIESVAAGAAAWTAQEMPTLTAEQSAVLLELAGADGFRADLLEGVTGSGKTEIYLRVIAGLVARGGQALVLVPEIALTPQLLGRFIERLGPSVAGFHSGMSEKERAQVWLRARAGEASVVVGTRSALFVPFARLGLIVVDEEHDVSYKQQEGLRYSARDVAVVRAQRLNIPVLLGSATPSLESLHNAREGRYRHLRMTQRVGSLQPPRVQPLDVRQQNMDHGLSPPLVDAVRRHLEQNGQALLFINRRGYAPVLLCHACGWNAGCKQCDARMTLHRARGRLVCHHCGLQQPVPSACPACGAAPLLPVGQGTERIEDALRNLFPRHRVERFDSDRMRRAGELERLLADIRSGSIHILVGTQILAKGHDFAGLTLVGIVSADQALYSADFRATERMAQLVTQVAGRAGRAGQPGEVLLQTHEPQHPLLQKLARSGYGAVCEALLEERRMAELPPYAHLALLRAESPDPAAALRFLAQARELLPQSRAVSAGQPMPAPMEQRAGRVRAQLLLRSKSRPALQKMLSGWVTQLDGLAGARRVRWAIDVDPYDLF